jgi:hypothetical protein
MMTVRALKGKPQTVLRDTDLVAERRHPWIRRIFGLTVLAGVAYAVWRIIEENGESHDAAERASLASERTPAGGVSRSAESERVMWVEVGGDTCPASHPVKGKLSSGIYHVPGGANYDRTKPDRCYVDATAAEADGLRPAKR